MKPLLLLSCLFILLSGFTSIGQGASIEKTKSAKRSVVRLYPNPSTDGTVTICSMADETLEFYLFDLDGKLIYQLSLKNKEKQTIRGLKKGTYMYNILDKDETVEGGKILVKTN